MPSLLEWYALGVVLVFVSVFVAAGYYDGKASGYVRQRWHTPQEWTALATLAGIGLAGLIALFGTVPDSLSNRRGVVALAVHVAPLVAGCLSLAVAASHGRTLARLRRAADAETGAVPARDPGTGVAVEGVVDADDPGESAALGRPGVCWSWRFYTRGMYGQDDENPRWLSRKGGSDGVPFRLDDGSGPVRVDPTDAHVDLLGERSEVYDADAEQPGRVGRNLRSSIAGEEYRYVETVATGGRRLVALGTVTEDGAVDAERIVDPGADGAGRRSALRALAFGLAGAVGIWLGVRLTADLFGTPIPV